MPPKAAPASSATAPSAESDKDVMRVVHAAASCLSGFVAGSSAASLVQPLDVVRTRIQIEAAKGAKVTAGQALAAVLREGRVAGKGTLQTLWRGVRPAMARLGTGNASYFLWLQLWRRVFERRGPDGRPRPSAWSSFLAGGASGLCTSVVLTPFTVVKTRAESGMVASQGVFHAMGGVLREEGVRGLFRGLVPTMATIGPFAALFLAVYTQVRSRLIDRWGHRVPSPVLNFASGCAAAAGSTLITQPMDVLRTRAQMGLSGPSGVLALAASIVAQQGVAGLMSGFGPRVMKRGLQTALVFSIFEEVRPRVDGLLVNAAAQVLH